EIPRRRCLYFRRIDLRIVDRLPSRFRDQIADRFSFLLQVALKIGSAAAEDVNRFVHKIPRRVRQSLAVPKRSTAPTLFTLPLSNSRKIPKRTCHPAREGTISLNVTPACIAKQFPHELRIAKAVSCSRVLVSGSPLKILFEK